MDEWINKFNFRDEDYNLIKRIRIVYHKDLMLTAWAIVKESFR